MGFVFFPCQKKAERIGKKNISKHKLSVKQIIWAVDVTDPYIIKSTCLTKAITAQILLNQQKYTSKLMIGVIKEHKNLEAHAWLEVDDDIVVGHSEREYIKILDI